MILPILLSAPLALAQVGLPSETVVTATRAEPAATETPSSRQVITGEELRRTGERSLPRAIARAAGVFVQETNLGGGAPILRGLIGNQILIVVDGVRLNDSTTRAGPNQSLNSIDPLTVERVEVLRGPISVLYGTDAIGGAILVWTKSRGPAGASEERRRVEAALDLSYQDTAEGGRAGLELSGASRDHGWLGIGSLQDWQDLESSGNRTIDHTGYHGNALFGSWTSRIDPARSLRLTASLHRELDVPRTDRLNTGFGQTQPANAEFEFALQDRQRYVLSYEDEAGGLLGDTMQARVSFRHYQEDRNLRDTGSSTRRMESDTTDTLGLGVDWKKAAGDSQLFTYGLDLETDQVDSTRTDLNLGTGTKTPKAGAFAPGSRFSSAGVFVQDDLLGLDPWDVTLGARYSLFDFAFEDFSTGDRVDGDFDALTASVRAGRDLAEGVRLTATLAQGFRAPNLADLAKNASFAGGTELANPDLEPEQSLLEELALELTREAWSASLAAYHNGVSDAIGRRLISAGGPAPGDETYQRENVGSLSIYGLEARARRRLGESPCSAELVAEYTKGRQYDDFVDPNTGETPFSDVPATRIPPLHGLIGLNFEPAATWHRIGWASLSYLWAFEQDELSPFDLSDPRIDPSGTPAWNTLDLDFGGPLGALGDGSSWSFGVHNIFDEAYRVHGSGFDGPGVGFVVGLRVAR